LKPQTLAGVSVETSFPKEVNQDSLSQLEPYLLMLSGSEPIGNPKHLVIMGQLGGHQVRILVDSETEGNFVYQDLDTEVE
jgi:hypothetical protein